LHSKHHQNLDHVTKQICTLTKKLSRESSSNLSEKIAIPVSVSVSASQSLPVIKEKITTPASSESIQTIETIETIEAIDTPTTLSNVPIKMIESYMVEPNISKLPIFTPFIPESLKDCNITTDQ